MTIKSKCLLKSVFLALIIFSSNFINSMEEPELSDDKANLTEQGNGTNPFNIIPNLAWFVKIELKNEAATEDCVNELFHDSDEEICSKFLGLPFNFMKLRLNKLSDNSIAPTLEVIMRYVVKFDKTDKAIKCYWQEPTFHYNIAESVSLDDQKFEQFRVELNTIVEGIEKLLEPKLAKFTDIVDEMAYILANIKSGKEILLYTVMMNLSFVIDPLTKIIILGNKISSTDGPIINFEQKYSIERSLGWVIENKFPREISRKVIQGIFDNINQIVDNKFSDLSFKPLTLAINSDKINPRPTITVEMQYVQKFDTKDKKVKRYWQNTDSYRKEASISSEEFEEFKNKLGSIVNDIEKVLEPLLFSYTDFSSQEAYLISNMKYDEEIILYDVTMNLSFVLEPVKK